MKQASLKLKTSIQKVDISNNIEARRIILNSMLSALALLAFLYVLFLGNMVFDIAERKLLEKEAITLSSEVGNLELAYLFASDKIDTTLSTSLGYREIKPTFATRKTLGQNFTGNSLKNKLANNEI